MIENLPTWYVAIIGGILMPFIVEFLKGKLWTSHQKSLFAFGCAVAAGTLATFLMGQLNVANTVATITVIFSISQLIYDQYLKDKFN